MSSGNQDDNNPRKIDPFRKVRTKSDAARKETQKSPKQKKPAKKPPAAIDPFRKVRTKTDAAAQPEENAEPDATPPETSATDSNEKIDPFHKATPKYHGKRSSTLHEVNPFHKVQAKGQSREEKFEPFRKIKIKNKSALPPTATKPIDPFHKVSETTGHLKRGTRPDTANPRAQRRLKFAALAVVAGLVIGVGLFTARFWSETEPDNTISEESLSNDLVADADVIIPAPPPPEVIELSGDPILIERQKTSADRLEKLPVTSQETAKNLTTTADIWYFNDVLLAANVNLMSALPLKQENLAFFRQTTNETEPAEVATKTQADAKNPQPTKPVAGAIATAKQPSQDPSSQASETASRPDMQADTDTEKATASDPLAARRGSAIAYIADETTVGRDSRTQVLNKFLSETTISEFLIARGFDAEDSRAVQGLAKEKFNIEKLQPGDIIAIRGYRLHPQNAEFSPVQVSIYQQGSFTGTLARADNEQYVIGEDPWFSKPLFEQPTRRSQTRKSYRLLDAIYSAATRNNIPRSVIGEAILLLSKSFDLKALAKPGETIKMIYADEPRDAKTGLGRLLYVGIDRKPKKLECFVFRLKPADPFECATGKGAAKSVSGMYTPVNGALTSRFGPRMHPILKKMKMHTGVDWAAPTGTPIHAAFSGRVTFAGVKGGYGNFIRLNHGKGRGTGYAHLSRFAKNLKKGNKVSAGQVIGYVGTTGRSTGPHLHFELYRNGRAVDPFGNFQRHIAKGGAVAIMVNRIVRIESAGNPNAKNPLSTATGLGQFIESTWMRMIRLHRPDILKGRTRAQVLALRTDPQLALEMTTKLTQGSASYLRARGQPVTPGNLYLAHFLGPEGAMKALQAPPDKQLLEIFGAGVIKANPFLTGKTADWVINWAARKMNRRGKRGKFRITRRPVNKYAASKIFQRFKSAIGTILSSS